MKTIDRKTAAILWAHEYKLVDENGVYEIIDISENEMFVKNKDWASRINFSQIGEEFKVLVRHYSHLTKEIEPGVVPLLKMAKLCGYDNLEKYEEDGEVFYGWNERLQDDYQGYEVAYDEKIGCIGVYYDYKDESNGSIYAFYNHEANDLFLSLHFKPSSLPDEACKFIELNK